MARPAAIEDMSAAIASRRFPTVTTFNRLEGRPRTHSFDRTLRAEVRDALWSIGRQQQAGELRATDAGSPALVSLRLETAPLRRYRGGDSGPVTWPGDLPADALVERRPLQQHEGKAAISYDLRLLTGRRWLRMVARVGGYAKQFVGAYEIERPDPSDRDDAAICSDVEAWQFVAAAAGGAMDGIEFAERWRLDPAAALEQIVFSPGDRDLVEPLAEEFVAWVDGLLVRPGPGEDAWAPSRLEYEFEASVADSGATALAAREYRGAGLEWHALDVTGSDAPGGDGPEPEPRTLLPVPLAFAGMPNDRWWRFEDGQTNFGDVDAETTDLGRLLLLEFGLVYAGDWLQLPLTVRAGSLVQVRGLVVTNVFGERFWIEPAGKGVDENWQRWSAFALSHEEAGAAADSRLLILPTGPRPLEGPPLEEVALVRDETANMVWGIETRVPAADGRSRPGREAATEMRRLFERRVEGLGEQPAAPPAAPLRYRLMSSVPENWIPFLPVHVEGSLREVGLQRGAMPRLVEGDPEPPARVRPRTALLRTGLDEGASYVIDEEQVPRAGVKLRQAFRRCRWYDGSAVVWLAAVRETGRGEGSAGLVYDRAEPVEPAGP